MTTKHSYTSQICTFTAMIEGAVMETLEVACFADGENESARVVEVEKV